MSASAPYEPPPSYEEAQGNAPYPAPYPQQYPGYPPKTNDFSADSGYPPPAPGANQPYPMQPGYPQQYPYGAPAPGTYPNQPGPYPTTGIGQTYTYPTAVASYNQQGVVLQPGTVEMPRHTVDERTKVVIAVVAVLCVVLFITVILVTTLA